MSDPKDLYKRLTAPFPKEAMSEDTSRGFVLDSIKAQYVIERMNEVFGVTGWTLLGEFKASQTGILFLGELIIKELDHKVTAVGFAELKSPKGKPKLIGDVYKSAKTDALSKAASWLGVGNEVFKGKGNRTPKPAPEPVQQPKQHAAPTGTMHPPQKNEGDSHRLAARSAFNNLGITDQAVMKTLYAKALRENVHKNVLENFFNRELEKTTK